MKDRVYLILITLLILACFFLNSKEKEVEISEKIIKEYKIKTIKDTIFKTVFKHPEIRYITTSKDSIVYIDSSDKTGLKVNYYRDTISTKKNKIDFEITTTGELKSLKALLISKDTTVFKTIEKIRILKENRNALYFGLGVRKNMVRTSSAQNNLNALTAHLNYKIGRSLIGLNVDSNGSLGLSFSFKI